MIVMRTIVLKELLLSLYFELWEEKTGMQPGLQMCQYSHYSSKGDSLNTDKVEFASHSTTLHYIITLIIMPSSELIFVCDKIGPWRFVVGKCWPSFFWSEALQGMSTQKQKGLTHCTLDGNCMWAILVVCT